MSDPAIARLYEDLPCQTVGANSWTREAIRRLPPLRTPPAILNLGMGQQAIVLASHFRCPVDAVDDDAQSLDQLMDAAHAAGVAQWVRPRRAPIDQPAASPESYDLIWSENGVRPMGMAKALDQWSPLLRKRGVLVVGDCLWREANPPDEAVAFWRRTYPAMTDDGAVHQMAKARGVRVYDSFTLPRAVWRSEYFEPLGRRIARLQGEAARDPALGAAIATAEAEIEMFGRWGDRFHYVFYLMRRV